jgi:iron(III) transport system substrate-binding protein
MTTAFERQTGVKVAMTRKSSGETYAQLKAEATNPRGDIWWGGTGDPHLQAAGEGLTIEYKSVHLAELQPWAVHQWERTNGRAVGIYSGALGFGYNIDLVKKKGVAKPKCWADLLDACRSRRGIQPGGSDAGLNVTQHIKDQPDCRLRTRR